MQSLDVISKNIRILEFVAMFVGSCHRNIDNKEPSTDMRDRTYIKDKDAAPLEAKQVKKEPPPVAKKKISIGQSKNDDTPSTPPPTAPKVNPKPSMHKRHRSESTMLNNDINADNSTTDNDAISSPILPKNLSIDEQSKRDIDEGIMDQKDPKMADSSELEENDEDYGNPCNNCDACTHGWDLHIWRNMCRNCNCTREDHANPDNKKEKVNVKFTVKENTKQSNMNSTTSSVVVRLSSKDKVPPPVSPKGNSTKTKMFIKQENENKERKNSTSNNERKLSATANERKNSTSNNERKNSSSMKDNLEQIRKISRENKEERRSSLRDENGKLRTRIDPKERLKLAEEEKRKSELQFSELDNMIDKLLDEKSVVSMDEGEQQADSYEKKPLEQMKSLNGGEEDEPQDSPMDDVRTNSNLLSIDQSTNQLNASDHEDDTDLKKIQRMEESIQRSLDLLEKTQPIKKGEMTREEVQLIKNKNVEEEILVIEEKRGSYFGLKDLENKIMDIIKIGSEEVCDTNKHTKSEEDDHRRTFIHQIPPNDFIMREKDDFDKYELREKEMFLIHLQQQAIGKAIYMDGNMITDNLTCSFCNQPISPKESFKFTDRLPDRAYHHDCFKCSECEQPLVDDIYFSKNDQIYCGRHYAEIYKGRCTGCDELIFDREYTVAEDRKWHIKHFCCFECKCQLGGDSYVLENEHTYCIACYHDRVASRCESCNKPIEIGTEWINFEERNWHALPECFCCHACKKDLCDMPFVPLGDNIYCSLDCLKS